MLYSLWWRQGDSDMSHAAYKSIHSPIRWVGGKSRLRQYIIPFIPDHTCYVEPFPKADKLALALAKVLCLC